MSHPHSKSSLAALGCESPRFLPAKQKTISTRKNKKKGGKIKRHANNKIWQGTTMRFWISVCSHVWRVFAFCRLAFEVFIVPKLLAIRL